MRVSSIFRGVQKNILSRFFYLNLFCFLSIAILFLLPSSADDVSGSEIPSFAIYDSNNQTGDEDWQWLEMGLADMLNNTFSQYEEIKTIQLSQIEEMVDKEKFSDLQSSKDAFLFQSLNDLLWVDIIFTGNYYLNYQDQISVELMMYKSSINEVFEFREISASYEKLFKLKEDVGKIILQELGLEIDDEIEQLLRKNISTSVEALNAYYHAIDLKDRAIIEYQGIDFPSKPLWAEAIEYAEKAVEIDPNFSEAYYLLVQIYERTKWTIREVRSLEKFIETAENNSNIQISYHRLSDSLYRLAYSKYSQSDIDSAIAHLKDSIVYNPYNVQARELLMRLYYQIGEASKALQQAEEIKKIEPGKRDVEWLARRSQQAAEYGKNAY